MTSPKRNVKVGSSKHWIDLEITAAGRTRVDPNTTRVMNRDKVEFRHIGQTGQIIVKVKHASRVFEEIDNNQPITLSPGGSRELTVFSKAKAGRAEFDTVPKAGPREDSPGMEIGGH